VIDDAPWRADNDMRTVFERADLRAHRRAAAQGQNLDIVDAARQSAQLFGDLIGEFARGAQHQRLNREIAGIEMVQQAKPESGGLAAAGFGLGDQIAALQNHRQAFGLDRGHLLITQGGKVLELSRSQRQGRKRSRGHVRLRLNGLAILTAYWP